VKTASEMTYVCVGWGVKLYSLTHSLESWSQDVSRPRFESLGLEAKSLGLSLVAPTVGLCVEKAETVNY